MSIILLIIGLILFVGLVVLHELGHALAARRRGVEVEEFGIGFPPKLWGKKLKNGTLLSINALPLGGFVRLKGEHDAATGKGTYGGASTWTKTQILLAGVVINWVTAAAIFTVLAFTGMPELPQLKDQFTIPSDTTQSKGEVVAVAVTKDSPAAKAGLQSFDVITSVEGESLKDAAELAKLTEKNAGKTIEVAIKRNDQPQKLQIALHKERQEGQGYAGISPGQEVVRRSTWSAPLVGVGLTIQFTGYTLAGLGQTIAQAVTGHFAQASQNVTGPVGIFTTLQQSSEMGFTPVLFLIGIISLSLAIMNTLPIPALDGGRLFVMLLFRALKKSLTKEREEAIQSTGFLALMILIVLITVVDVGRLFGK